MTAGWTTSRPSPLRVLAARGGSLAAFDHRCIPPRGAGRCPRWVEHSRYSSSSCLAGWAPRRSRCPVFARAISVAMTSPLPRGSAGRPVAHPQGEPQLPHALTQLEGQQ